MVTLDRAISVADAALDVVGIAVLAMTLERELLFSNRAALALLADEGRMGGNGGRLRLPAPADAALLGILRSPTRRGWFQVPRPGRRPILGRVTPMPTTRGMVDSEAVLVFLDNLDAAQPNAVAPALRALYGLTDAEARVACLVGYGHAPLEAASALGISEATARTQLKQVFVKLGVSRQSDLVTAVLRVHYIEPIS